VLWHNGSVSFKTGFIVGAAVGYVLGAKAGRERYDQIQDWVGKVSGDPRFQDMTDKGKAFADVATQRVKDTVEERFGSDGETDA
jgi:hypothetical protein